MRFTNFLSGAITSAKLTPCQEVHTQQCKLEKPHQDVLKVPNYSTSGFPSQGFYPLGHLGTLTTPT